MIKFKSIFAFSTILAIFASILLILWKSKSDLKNYKAPESTKVVGEIGDFVKIFESSGNLRWRLKSNKAFIYNTNEFEIKDFFLEITAKDQEYVLEASWGVVTLENNRIKELKIDGDVHFVLKSEGVELRSDSCFLKNQRDLDCYGVKILTKDYLIRASRVTFNIENLDFNLTGKVETVTKNGQV